MLKHPRWAAGAIGALCSLSFAPPLVAEETTTLKQAAEAIKAAPAGETIEPDSLAALKAMGDYVAAQQSIGLTSRFEAELLLDNGQKVEIGGTADYLARRPDRLKVDLTTDLGARTFLFDGHSLYVVSPKDEVYGQLDEVGPSIKDMLEAVEYHADIEVPLADLFNFGTDDAVGNTITAGFLVGPATIGDQATQHWAFRTEGKDFEVWIADGDKPLPLKLVMSDTTEPSHPRFEAALSWSAADTPDSAFAFTPPAGATEIPVLVHEPEEETANAQ